MLSPNWRTATGGPSHSWALLQITGDEEAFGLLAIYQHGPNFELVAVDAKGRRQEDLATLLVAAFDRRENVDASKWTSQPSWKKGIRRLAESLPEGEPPQAVAAFRIRRTFALAPQG